MAVVYIHMKSHNREIYYVGIGNNLKRAYITNGRNNLWQKVFKKHGRIVDIISKDISIEEAKEIEKFLIALIGRLNIKEGTLVNLTDGGDGIVGHRFSDATKEKMSKSAKGRIVSEDARKKIGLAHINKKLPEYHKRKISEKKKADKNKPWLKGLAVGRKIKQENGIRIKELTTGIEFNLVDSKKYFDIPNRTIAENSRIGNPLRSKKFNGLNFTRLKGVKKNEECVLKILPTTKRSKPTNQKIVLDSTTGIFWGSILEASNVYDIQITKLKRKLSGKYINDTNLKIV